MPFVVDVMEAKPSRANGGQGAFLMVASVAVSSAALASCCYAAQLFGGPVLPVPADPHVPALPRPTTAAPLRLPVAGAMAGPPRRSEQLQAQTPSVGAYGYHSGMPQGGQGFQGQMALLGSLAAVALTSLVIATMALTSGMIGLAGVGFALYSFAVALQWCLPYVSQVMPMQVLALPVAVCTWLAYRRSQGQGEAVEYVSSENEAVITPYKPQRSVKATSQALEDPAVKVDGRGPPAKPGDLSLAQQRAYLRHLYQLPAAERPDVKRDTPPLRRFGAWLRDGLFGRSHPDASDGFLLEDSESLRRAKRALQRAYRLPTPPEVRAEEWLRPEEAGLLQWPHRQPGQEREWLHAEAARAMLQHLYDSS
eukprot:EG_transcript_9229